MVYRTAPFSMILNDAKPSFQGHVIFNDEYLRNGTKCGHRYNNVLMWTYALHNNVISNDLE